MRILQYFSLLALCNLYIDFCDVMIQKGGSSNREKGHSLDENDDWCQTVALKNGVKVSTAAGFHNTTTTSFLPFAIYSSAPFALLQHTTVWQHSSSMMIYHCQLNKVLPLYIKVLEGQPNVVPCIRPICRSIQPVYTF